MLMTKVLPNDDHNDDCDELAMTIYDTIMWRLTAVFNGATLVLTLGNENILIAFVCSFYDLRLENSLN